MAAVDKFKSDQRALNELVKEMLDRQSNQEEQIGKIKQQQSDMRFIMNKSNTDIDLLRLDIDNQSDS